MNRRIAILAAVAVFINIFFLYGCSSPPHDPRVNHLKEIAHECPYATKALEDALDIATNRRFGGGMPGSKQYWYSIRATLQRWGAVDMTGKRTVRDVEAIKEMARLAQCFESKAPRIPSD